MIRPLILITAILIGISFNSLAQSRAEKKKAQQMARIEKKADRKAKRRPEDTQSAQATYGNSTPMRGFKMPSRGPRKRLNIHKPAKGTHSNSMQWRARKKG